MEDIDFNALKNENYREKFIAELDTMTGEELDCLERQFNGHYKKTYGIDISAIIDTVVDAAINTVIAAVTKKELASLESRIVD